MVPVALNGLEETVRRVPHGREYGAPGEVLGPVGVGDVGDEAGGGGERAGSRHSGEVGVVGGVAFRVLGVVPCNFRYTGSQHLHTRESPLMYKHGTSGGERRRRSEPGGEPAGDSFRGEASGADLTDEFLLFGGAGFGEGRN